MRRLKNGKKAVLLILVLVLLHAVPCMGAFLLEEPDYAPEHHKDIRHNENGSYTITLDVKGRPKDCREENAKYTFRNVVITDVLSEYVQIPEATGFTWAVSAENEAGEDVDISGVGILVDIDWETNTVRAEFPKNYVLDGELTYRVSFEAEPTQKAYDTFAPTAGSSEKSGYGFCVNDRANLRYTCGRKNTEPRTVDYSEKPMIQIPD